MKISRWEHEVAIKSLFTVLRDAVVMEKLTASPRIVDMYGHCGTAVWVEALPFEVEDVIVPGSGYAKQKEKTREAVKDLAAEMLRLQAGRSAMPGVRYPADTAWQKEFEAEFPYQETDDQLAAIAAIKKDMADEQPMDRLICGDVGYGKMNQMAANM